jgi:hypothetical protein
MPHLPWAAVQSTTLLFKLNNRSHRTFRLSRQHNTIRRELSTPRHHHRLGLRRPSLPHPKHQNLNVVFRPTSHSRIKECDRGTGERATDKMAEQGGAAQSGTGQGRLVVVCVKHHAATTTYHTACCCPRVLLALRRPSVAHARDIASPR